MPSNPIETNPEAKDFVSSVRKHWGFSIDDVDLLFQSLPIGIRNEALKESLSRASQRQNTELLAWTLAQGIDINVMLSGDYPYSLELIDMLTNRVSGELKPEFLDISEIAVQSHQERIQLDALALTCLYFKDTEIGADKALSRLERYSRVVGDSALSKPNAVNYLFGSLSARSDHKDLVWALASQSKLAENMSSTSTLQALIRRADSKDRAKLVSAFEGSVISMIRETGDISDNESLLADFATYGGHLVMRHLAKHIAPKINPIVHQELLQALLHRPQENSLLFNAPDLHNSLMSEITKTETFGLLFGRSDNIFQMRPTSWSLKTSATLISLGYWPKLEEYDYQDVAKCLWESDRLLTESEMGSITDYLTNEISYKLSKSLRRALKNELPEDHYLKALETLDSRKQNEALIVLCAHEQILLDQGGSKTEPNELNAPLLAAGKRLARSEGNPHYRFRPIIDFLMSKIDDQFKIDLRPKDKKYVRALIMAGKITDSRHFSALTPKELGKKFSMDLGA